MRERYDFYSRRRVGSNGRTRKGKRGGQNSSREEKAASKHLSEEATPGIHRQAKEELVANHQSGSFWLVIELRSEGEEGGRVRGFQYPGDRITNSSFSRSIGARSPRNPRSSRGEEVWNEIRQEEKRSKRFLAGVARSGNS